MIRVALYGQDGQEVGWTEFLTLLVHSEADYRCSAPRLLKLNQVKAISRELRKLPQVNSGTIGEFRWRVE